MNGFGFGATNGGIWHHYFEKILTSYKNGMHAGNFENETINRLQEENKILMHKGWTWSSSSTAQYCIATSNIAFFRCTAKTFRWDSYREILFSEVFLFNDSRSTKWNYAIDCLIFLLLSLSGCSYTTESQCLHVSGKSMHDTLHRRVTSI